MKTNKQPVLLVIDGDNLLHRAYHKFGGFTSKAGAPSSMIFGFPYILRRALIKYEPSMVIAAFDGGRHPDRLAILPNYKNREHKEDFDYESYVSQKEDVMKMLGFLGIHVVHKVGQEADDLIYQITRLYLEYHIIIVSSDKDFHQLINDRVSVFSPTKESLLTPKNMGRMFPYTPEQTVDYLILDGDKSDKIPGLRGMGEKRITQFLKDYGSIRKYLDKKRINPHLKGPTWDEMNEVYQRNRRLIDLGFFWRKYNRKNFLPSKREHPYFNAIEVAIIAKKYNSKTLLKLEFINTFKAIGKNA